MTSEICKDNSVATGSTKQLKDIRDQKYYWVSKLADGNCWMTQNLDFNVPSTLSSADTDIQEDEEGATKTVTTNTIKVDLPKNWPSSGNTYNGYLDPGDYIYNGPSGNHSQGTACSANNSMSNLDVLAPCSPQFSKSDMDNTSTQVLNDANRHYHVGNYYSWSAATVKSGDSLTTNGTQAPDSICPRGWTLPTSTSSTTGQFAELLIKYGVNSNLVNGDYAIYKEPLYFVYGGNLSSSTLNDAGGNGYYWSSKVISSTNAFNLTFASGVNPANNNARYRGHSVRCVAI